MGRLSQPPKTLNFSPTATMCDCVPTPLFPSFGIGFRRLGFTGSYLNFRAIPTQSLSFTAKSAISARVGRNSRALGSDEFQFYDELGFKGKGQRATEPRKVDESIDNSNRDVGTDEPASSSVDFLEFHEKGGVKSEGSLKDEDLVKIGSPGGDALKLDELETRNEEPIVKSSRQLMKRSNMIAKQVICVQSALSLGFISQLWVDTNSWVVVVIEVRPNLLSGELERFLLDDVTRVGDVVLIQDESVMENEFKMVGLETLVGYNVVTPGRRYIGKVRGFTFNINSGTVESLELDSFGISVIPSSLVSTYALFIEDVLEVVSDTVVVHEAAAAHIQRITKGFWDAKNVGYSAEELEDYYDIDRRPVRSSQGRNRQRSYNGRKSQSKMRDTEDDWELPLDFL